MHGMNNHKTFDLFIKAIIMVYYTKPEFSFVTCTWHCLKMWTRPTVHSAFTLYESTLTSIQHNECLCMYNFTILLSSILPKNAYSDWEVTMKSCRWESEQLLSWWENSVRANSIRSHTPPAIHYRLSRIFLGLNLWPWLLDGHVGSEGRTSA